MRAGVIDLGSNSALLLIGDFKDNDGLPEILYEIMETTGLGEGVSEGGFIGEDKFRKGIEVLGEFKNSAEEYGVDTVRAYGTSVFREAKNTGRFVKLAREKLDIPIEVISPEEEGELSYLSATVSTKIGKAVVLDVGAMSAQISWGVMFTMIKTMSFPLGCVRLSEKFGLYDRKSPEELVEVSEFIKNELKQLPYRKLTEFEPITVGGSAVAVASIISGLDEYDRELIQGKRITRADIEREYLKLFKIPAEDRKKLTPFEPERGPILPAGLLVIANILELLGVEDTTICWWGLTYGMLLKTRMETKS